jgi:hypothetical protein
MDSIRRSHHNRRKELLRWEGRKSEPAIYDYSYEIRIKKVTILKAVGIPG